MKKVFSLLISQIIFIIWISHVKAENDAEKYSDKQCLCFPGEVALGNKYMNLLSNKYDDLNLAENTVNSVLKLLANQKKKGLGMTVIDILVEHFCPEPEYEIDKHKIRDYYINKNVENRYIIRRSGNSFNYEINPIEMEHTDAKYNCRMMLIFQNSFYLDNYHISETLTEIATACDC